MLNVAFLRNKHGWMDAVAEIIVSILW